jgi:hypothetical protein
MNRIVADEKSKTSGVGRLLGVMGGVLLDEMSPLNRDVVFVEDGLDGAFSLAKVTADATLGVDEELLRSGEAGFVLGRMDAVDGTDDEAGGVFDVDAREGDHIGHDSNFLSCSQISGGKR